MKKQIIEILLLVLFAVVFSPLYAQDEEGSKGNPVFAPWDSGVLINHQTSVTQDPKTLEMVINHRFGSIENGVSDVFGIMAPGANIRLGLNYTPMKNLNIGFGTSAQKQYQDFQAKYTLFEQTDNNSMPVSISLYGNAAIDAREESVFGQNYEFTDRLSYFSEVIVGRKVNDAISLQASVNFTHYNSVDSLLDNDKIGIGFGGRIKVSPLSSITFEGGIPLKIQSIAQYTSFTDHPKMHLSIGYEIYTGSHSFQFFVTNSLGILNQELYMYNQNEFDSKSIRFGFNITRLWNY